MEVVATPGIYARIRLGLDLARSCNNESDWLFHGDGVKCRIPRTFAPATLFDLSIYFWHYKSIIIVMISTSGYQDI